ncbi:MAG: polysaccharide biosynthesis/export family protein [Vicinamibacterales bacterium]
MSRYLSAAFVVLTLLVGGISPFGTRAVLAQNDVPAPSPDYTVGARDVLVISVWKQADLSGTFEVGEDGAIAFPLIGRVTVAGQKLPAIEKTLTDRLADGFIRSPQVAVSVESFRSQQVFVLGEVKAPGAVPLTGGMTVVEALVRAGSYSDSLGGEVIVSRMPDGANGRPVLPGTVGAVEVQRFDLRDLRSGRTVQNAPLQDGDTVFITRAETVFIEGQVANPGVYVFEKQMTVLRLISLAGGATPIGSQKRPRIRRIADGKVTEFRAKLTDVLQPGDTVIIPTRLI